ncbi:MAG: HAD-IIIA family hydrolase [Microscillaceae bacterium]|nr:HAD-IIIA family hydrolase [Microscillaceae bacterium]MDW8461470.1 HAD-IIIA family hydrolase [Cytophagales bacterium]
MRKCIFLDRDGVLNYDKVDYVYQVADFRIIEGVIPALHQLKQAGFLLVIVTNQSGIAKGIYKRQDMWACFDYLQQQCNGIIDAHYYAPWHPSVTNSLMRKPNSLMLEKAIAKFGIDVTQSWIVGDSERDILAAKKVGVRGIKVSNKEQGKTQAVIWLKDLAQATEFILQHDLPN